MIFKTRAEWEIKDPVLKALGEDKSVRTYPFIEIDLNIPLYHVDILIPADEKNECQIGRRFVMHNIEHVKDLIKQKKILDYNIYLETPRNINQNNIERHKVKKLDKVIHGKDKTGCDVKAYVFADGDNYIDGEVNSVDDIEKIEIIFDINKLQKGTPK